MSLETKVVLGLIGVIAFTTTPVIGDLGKNPIGSIEHKIVASNYKSAKPIGPPEREIIYVIPNEPILVIDKSNYKLFVLEYRCSSSCNWVRHEQYDIAIGMGIGDKQRKGDNRTPEGNYKIIWAGHKYGGPAFLLNYPNGEDKSEGKTGGDILIHVTNERNLRKRKSQGCIGLNRDDIYDLKKYVKIGTKVLIRDNL